MLGNTILGPHVLRLENEEQVPRSIGGVCRGSFPRCLAAAVFLAACAQAPTESRAGAGLINLDHLNVDTIVVNRASANRIAAHPLADAQGRVSASAAEMLTTPDGPQLLSFIIACALPADTTLLADVGNNTLEFLGDNGLAPQWQSGPLDLAGQRWVSACLFSRVNARDVTIPISMRGPLPVLDASDDEREIWELEEGAFYGNMFVPPDQPLPWFACRGKAQASGGPDLFPNRICAKPDPAKPGFTRCGFVFAGDCGSFAVNPTCESFSTNGTFYQRCHTAPIRSSPGGEVFEQVITVFTSP